MRRIAALLACVLAFGATPALADDAAVLDTGVTQSDSGSVRYFVAPPAPLPQGIAAYGPFRVLDGKRAALVDVTDEDTPVAFAAMLHAFPGLSMIEFVECPGTDDDNANLRLGRMIRKAGMTTHVPSGGSVRSGAVELFLAGVHRSVETGTEFAVHAWMDDRGRQATDYPANAPENIKYLTYYKEMGMSQDQAAKFYAMTNSVRFEDAKWLTGSAIREWVPMN